MIWASCSPSNPDGARNCCVSGYEEPQSRTDRFRSILRPALPVQIAGTPDQRSSFSCIRPRKIASSPRASGLERAHARRSGSGQSQARRPRPDDPDPVQAVLRQGDPAQPRPHLGRDVARGLAEGDVLRPGQKGLEQPARRPSGRSPAARPSANRRWQRAACDGHSSSAARCTPTKPEMSPSLAIWTRDAISGSHTRSFEIVPAQISGRSAGGGGTSAIPEDSLKEPGDRRNIRGLQGTDFAHAGSPRMRSQAHRSPALRTKCDTRHSGLILGEGHGLIGLGSCYQGSRLAVLPLRRTRTAASRQA